jgi:hypothetical protein
VHQSTRKVNESRKSCNVHYKVCNWISRYGVIQVTKGQKPLTGVNRLEPPTPTKLLCTMISSVLYKLLCNDEKLLCTNGLGMLMNQGNIVMTITKFVIGSRDTATKCKLFCNDEKLLCTNRLGTFMNQGNLVMTITRFVIGSRDMATFKLPRVKNL